MDRSEFRERLRRALKWFNKTMCRTLPTKDHEETWKRFDWYLSVKANTAMFFFLLQNVVQANTFSIDDQHKQYQEYGRVEDAELV